MTTSSPSPSPGEPSLDVSYNESVPIPTGVPMKLVVAAGTFVLSFVLQTEEGEILGGKPYKLTAGGKTYDGTSADDGTIEQTLPQSVADGELRVELEDGEHVWPLQFE